MPKNNTKNNTNDTPNLAERLDEVIGQDSSSPVDSSCSDGSCSTGSGGADIDPRLCPTCHKPTSYQYNITHLPADRSHWPGCLC